MKLIFFFFILMIGQIQANTCGRNLDLPVPRMNQTESLISYLTLLIDQQIIGEKELVGWRDRLQAGQLTNPIASRSTDVDSSALVHYAEVQKQIERSGIDLTKLLTWSYEYLKASQQAIVAREKTQEDTMALYREIKFLPVPGSRTNLVSQFFKWRRWHKKQLWTSVPPRKLHSFEMMDTPVTQKQWAEIMKWNPSHITQGPDNTEVSIASKLIEMLPNSPVENITWWSAIAFANQLSEMAGLKPAYDLREAEFLLGSKPERGDLSLFLGRLKINAPNENIYLTEGYRLPTEAEFEHVLSLAGFKDEASRYGPDMAPYSWLQPGPAHSVATLRPLLINGQPFYDLIGNISEWSHDIPIHSTRHRLDLLRAARGGTSTEDPATLWKRHGHRSWDIGFRLVRTLKP